MKLLVSVLLGVLLAGLPVSAQPSASNDHLIIPSRRIGPIVLGMSIVKATAILGTPNPAHAFSGTATAFRWGEEGFVVEANQAGTIYWIESPFDPTYATPEGLRVGSPAKEIDEKMGPPSRVVPMGPGTELRAYELRGVAFLVVTGRQYANFGLVNRIGVFMPARASQ